MRHRIAVVGTSETARSIALLLLVRDDCEVLMTGEDGDGLRAAATALAVEPRVDGPVPVTGITAARIVVLCDGQPAPVHDLRTRCPDALLVIATAAPAADGVAVQGELRWPRQRVLGVDLEAAAGPPTQRAAAAVRLVDHVLADRGRVLTAVVQTTVDGGPDGWGCVSVTVGAAGIQQIGPQDATPAAQPVAV